MGLGEFFGFAVPNIVENAELPEIFPVSMTSADFVKTDILNIYNKILTDVVERVEGLNEDQQVLLWDSCVKSQATDGLVTLLAKAMSDKADLFLVYDQSIKVLRRAQGDEIEAIRRDYSTKASSPVGVFISFKNYVRSDMVKLYSALEYCTVVSLNKSMNLARAIQFKMNDLRGSVSMVDSAAVVSQALTIAKSLGEGKDIIVDGRDVLATATLDLTSVKASIEFLNQKRSFYLGMPSSYINGEQTGGLGSTGEGDTKAVERGLRSYYFAVVKPALESIFGVKVSYKSQDFRQINQGLEALKTFALIDDEELISVEEMRTIISQLFDFDGEAG